MVIVFVCVSVFESERDIYVHKFSKVYKISS